MTDETAYLMQSPANARRLLEAMNQLDRDDDEGWAGTVTTDHILAVIGGILGGALTCLALLIRYAHHTNTAAAKGHRP